MSGDGESNSQSNTQPLAGSGTSSNSLHSKKTDIAWKHCTLNYTDIDDEEDD
ncbi:hypothetical protein Fmac_024778 [Flemingia macrophylla]|uniref:Uncharacterized protein n=1 Tax=Flemingia macrophylla TaxID=520843 RepID=A0ABD1LQD1_9FABA